LATPPRALHYRRTSQVDQDLAGSDSPWGELFRRRSTHAAASSNGVAGVDAAPRHFVT